MREEYSHKFFLRLDGQPYMAPIKLEFALFDNNLHKIIVAIYKCENVEVSNWLPGIEKICLRFSLYPDEFYAAGNSHHKFLPKVFYYMDDPIAQHLINYWETFGFRPEYSGWFLNDFTANYKKYFRESRLLRLL